MSDDAPHEALSGLVPRAMMEARERNLQAEIERLQEWIDGADHQPGCSGGYDGYRCKCGKPEGSDQDG
jgi:hypothetical protein